VIEGTTLYFATSPAFMEECRNNPSGLAQNADFQKTLARVSQTGNGLLYASPRLFGRLHDLERLNPQLPAQNMQVLKMVLRNLPRPERSLVSVRMNLPDGILVQSYLNRSLKQDVVAAAIYNPVSIGLMAAMAVPAFQKVRTASQEKAILNNLRQLAAAADQYYLEHGVDTASFDKLVGPDAYVRHITPVAGENYETLTFKQGVQLVVRTVDGRVVRYPESARPARPITSPENGAAQTLELEATGPTRIKVVQESGQAVLFEGQMEPGQPVILRKLGRLVITVEAGRNLRVKVNGRNHAVPIEDYGRFILD
jgi:type IV pilus assembly protein PilA